MTDRERLKQLLLEKSYRKGIFTLSSGRTSDFYIDGKQTTLSAEGAYLCGKLLYNIIKENSEQIGAVGGMTLGADPLVTAVSLISYLEKTPIPAFIVRKEPKKHGTSKWIEGSIETGARVAIVDDVVTSGGSIIKGYDGTVTLGGDASLRLSNALHATSRCTRNSTSSPRKSARNVITNPVA